MSGTLPCDVERVLTSNCQSCHSNPPKYGAPMPLVTYADLHADAVTVAGKKVFEQVRVRTHDDRKPMPQPPRPRLRADEQALLDAWIDRGAPSGAGTCGFTDAGKREGGSIDTVEIKDPPAGCPNVTLKASSAWNMPQSTTDEYVCFGVDVTLSKKRHLTHFWPKIDNPTITHHALVYVADSSNPSMPQPCASFSVMGKRLVYGWAPGSEPFELPAEAGFALEGTTHFVVQMHYSNLRALAGQSDGSSIELCTTEQLRANDADVMAFGSTKFSIPARGSREVDCSLNVPSMIPNLHVFRSMPHMHQLGTAIGSSLSKPGASPVVIDEVSNWSFGNQPWNAVDATIQAGDTVRTWCKWQNGTDAPVGFGEETSAEMCYHFMMYYPRIVGGGWRWDLPLGLAQCVEK